MCDEQRLEKLELIVEASFWQILSSLVKILQNYYRNKNGILLLTAHSVECIDAYVG